MFADFPAFVQGGKWGAQFDLPDGTKVDSGVREFAEALAVYFRAKTVNPIVLHQPIVLDNTTPGPAILIRNSGEQQQHGVRVQDEQGRQAQLGIGLGNYGLVASEFLPNATYFLDPSVTVAALGPGGVGNADPTSNGYQGLGSGYAPPGTSQPNTGTGVPGQQGSQGGSMMGLPLGQVAGSLERPDPDEPQFALNWFGQPICVNACGPPAGTGGGGSGACTDCPTATTEVVTSLSFDSETCELTYGTTSITYATGS